MSQNSSALINKLWNYCNILRDDGLSYGDYVEQLTFLLFLKMTHGRTQPPYNQPSSKEPGMLRTIFRKAQNKIQDPAKLKRLIADLIDKESWSILDADVKGDVYEGLLQKNAEDVKSGAGQYFTPRPLIRAITDVMQPKPGLTIMDPAAGTGGFLLAAHEYISHHYVSQMDADEKRFLRLEALHGIEIVDAAARLCAIRRQDVAPAGAVVVPAKKSQHLVGHAVDVNIKDGNTVNTFDKFDTKKESASADAFVAQVKAVGGIRWGGDFADVDYVHFDDFLDPHSEEYEMTHFFVQGSFHANHPMRLIS